MPLNHQRSRCQIRQMHWLKMPGMPVSWDDLCRWPVAAGGGGLPYWPRLLPPPRQAEQADRALLRSLTLTGGAAATTTAELWKMAGVISDEAGGGIRQAAENLARLAESGKYTAGQLRIMGKPQRWLQTVGTMPGRWKKPLKGLQQIR
ncbi:hypothetical protein CGC46_10070 [Escherichia coli O121:H19]|nr:hypothetical protein CGC46_10070 [Escherichia coli O121:H19]